MEKIAGSGSNRRRDADRRTGRSRFVLHERRTGFDRRGPVGRGPAAAILGNVVTVIRDRPGTLWMLLATVNVLNLADYFLTLNVLASGGGEANPIMNSLFSMNPAYAGGFKVMAVLLTTLLVWRLRRFRRALEVTLVMVAIFTFVFFYHIAGLMALG